MYIVVGRLLLIVPNHHPADDNDEDDHDGDDGVDVKDDGDGDDEERNPNSEMLRRPSWSTSPACSNSSNSSLLQRFGSYKRRTFKILTLSYEILR